MERGEGLFGVERERIAGFVQVVPERGMEVPGGLTYGVPEGMEGIEAGERVEVPMGRGSKLATGYVIGTSGETLLDVNRVKLVRSRTGVSLPSGMMDLARWVSEYYCAPMGMVLASMVPSSVKRATGRVTRTMVERTGEEPGGKLTPSVARAWESIRELGEDAFPVGARELAHLIEASNAGPVNKLVAMGVLRQVEIEGVRARAIEGVSEAVALPELTGDQRGVVSAIARQMDTFGVHLLRGVTGSGKTEVYLRLIGEMLGRGGSAIVLVPEISLTPQAVERYSARFGGETVSVLHSGLTSAQRHREWRRVREGSARIALGARSAVFAPFEHGEGELGLIVVDEEHDGAYKQEELPRYHARDVAIVRGQMAGCPVVLGSATPSLESWHNAKAGKATLHRLPERVGGGVLPRVEIVDLQDELSHVEGRVQREAMLGSTLVRQLQETFDAGLQSIVMLNRRGFATMFCCTSRGCGYQMRCSYCDVLMAWHRGRDLPRDGVVRCHHCGASQRMPRQCPDCGKPVRTFGAGAQRVEEAIAEVVRGLGEEQIQRMDSDSMHSARHYHEALDRFGRGETRVLVGTQMVAKGLDYPNVGLVGVVSADTALHMPDFRAEERTFQLVSQVAGRAGRSEVRGRVVVQTFEPGARAIVDASRHDYESFADRELEIRKGAGLPPAGRLARIVTRDAVREKSRSRARELYELLTEVAKSVEGVRVDDVNECVIARLREQYRFEVLVWGRSATGVQEVLGSVRAAGKLKSDREVAVDVDPVGLM
ncbi:MAG: replication restart helicase PriA [Planctomycetota bacterium]|jgi:primosomal protein N' (replication factor Y)